MRSAMLAKGCNVTEFAPSANLLEDRGPEAGIYRLTSLNPEFIARNRFSATPTIILVDQYWRVLWSQGGALRSSELSATIAEQPSSMLMALLKPVELHPPHPSQAISKASAPPAPASLDARTVQIPVADSPTDGPASAPVVVVEFADFQCPYCALVARPLRQLRAKYPNGVRLVYKQYPLEFHEYARKAAGLSVVAAQRGRFWPVYDELFKASPELSESILSQTATDAGMDAGKLGELVRSTNVQHQIDGDIQLGKSVGVNATPTLFVNGRLYHGPIDPANLERLVTQELARQAPIPHAGQ
jgi:protein-disulfide isomerase